MRIRGFVLACLTMAILILSPSLRADDKKDDKKADDKNPKLWTVDYDAAVKTAKSNNLDILMEFTGSDWCPPCKQLKANVFDNEVFKKTAPKHFVLLKIDLPNDKSKQSEKEKKQAVELTKKFKIEGFPTIILLDSKGKTLSRTSGYGGEDAKAYTDELVRIASARKERDKYLPQAEKAKGIEKAKLLDKALDGLGAEVVLKEYRPLVDEIIKLDSDNKAKLKSKYEALAKLPEIQKALVKIQRENRGKADAALKAINALIKKEKPEGVALQEATFLKGIILYGTDKKASKKTLEEAIKIAPNTQKARRFAAIMKEAFKE